MICHEFIVSVMLRRSVPVLCLLASDVACTHADASTAAERHEHGALSNENSLKNDSILSKSVSILIIGSATYTLFSTKLAYVI